MTAERGRYLFAVARGLEPCELVDARGIGGEPLEVVDHRGLQAVVCDVALEEFGESALRRNLEELAWLERVARAHDDVVRRVANVATTAPMRLVTICSDDDRVRARVDELHQPLSAALDRVEGCSEWSVKAYLCAPAATAPAGDRPSSGADYLRRKRQDADARRLEADRAATSAQRIHAAFAAGSVAGRRLAAQDPRLSGRQDTMLLNDAFLVPDVEAGEFANLTQEVRARHPEVELVVQGPWPPYSFAVLE